MEGFEKQKCEDKASLACLLNVERKGHQAFCWPWEVAGILVIELEGEKSQKTWTDEQFPYHRMPDF